MAHLFSIANACLLSPVQTDALFRLMRSPRFFANARNVSESSGTQKTLVLRPETKADRLWSLMRDPTISFISSPKPPDDVPFLVATENAK